MNEDLIDVNQDKHGVGGSRIGNSNCKEGSYNCQIWAKPLHDGTYAVALYNAGMDTNEITLNFDLLNKSWTSVTMRDLWAHKDLGTFSTSFSTQVESHGTAVYVVASTT